MLLSIVIFSLVFLLSASMTYKLIHLFRATDLVDVPNERSSHIVLTPKGGGLSIVILTLITLVVLSLNHHENINFSISMMVGLIVIATTGFFDDIYNISILRRVVLYGLAIFASIIILEPEQKIMIGNISVEFGSIAYVVYAIYIFWVLNLFNFMDGTDGYVAVQTLTTSIFSCLMLIGMVNVHESILLLVIFSSTLGFLVWNWAPAKIFMGDVGSCSLGFIFALFSIFTESHGYLSISIWLILLSPFIGDATLTLFKRVISGETWYQAHNGHAYQKLYQLGMSHKKIALGLLAMNTFFVLPIAYYAQLNSEIEIYFLIACYTIIGLIWVLISRYYYKYKDGFNT